MLHPVTAVQGSYCCPCLTVEEAEAQCGLMSSKGQTQAHQTLAGFTMPQSLHPLPTEPTAHRKGNPNSNKQSMPHFFLCSVLIIQRSEPCPN